jgi:hypothetical protein
MKNLIEKKTSRANLAAEKIKANLAQAEQLVKAAETELASLSDIDLAPGANNRIAKDLSKAIDAMKAARGRARQFFGGK